MNEIDKTKILVQLAKSNTDKAQTSLLKEFSKIKPTLISSLKYEELEKAIEELSFYIHKVADEAVETLKGLLFKLSDEKVELNADYLPYADMYNSEKLQTNILEVLIQLRYWQPDIVEKIARIFVGAACSKSNHLQEEAKKSLELLARIDLDAYENPAIYLHAQRTLLDIIIEWKEQIIPEHIDLIWNITPQIFTADIQKTEWHSNTVNFVRAGIPESEALIDLRQKLLDLLINSYPIKKDVYWKKRMINALNDARSEYSSTGLSENSRKMIHKNVLQVLEFFKELVSSENFSIITKLEHDAYWAYYHNNSEEIALAALEIRDVIFENVEYQFFRKLIGHEVIDRDWEECRKTGMHRDHTADEKEAITLAKNIRSNEINSWFVRILNIVDQIDYTENVCFKFDNFITEFTKNNPERVFNFIKKNHSKLSNHIPAFIIGLNSSNPNLLQKLMCELLPLGLYTRSFARLFNLSNVKSQILKDIYQSAIYEDDEVALIEIMAGSCRSYEENNGLYFNLYFENILDIFIKQKKSIWVRHVWFIRSNKNIIENANEGLNAKILEALLNLETINFESESLLLPIARIKPIRVMEFFVKRLEYAGELKRQNKKSKYEGIPYRFSDLKSVFASAPEDLVLTAYELWKKRQFKSIFKYYGAKLVSNTFSRVSEDLENILIPYVLSDDDQDRFFVLSIISNFDGD